MLNIAGIKFVKNLISKLNAVGYYPEGQFTQTLINFIIILSLAVSFWIMTGQEKKKKAHIFM